MRKATQWAIVSLVVFLVGAHSSSLQANLHYIEDTYYDCALNEVWYCTTDCSGTEYCANRHGEFWYHEVIRCSTDVTVLRQWYQWNGTQWVPISGPPSPTC